MWLCGGQLDKLGRQIAARALPPSTSRRRRRRRRASFNNRSQSRDWLGQLRAAPIPAQHG
jgi:hypothetical protein